MSHEKALASLSWGTSAQVSDVAHGPLVYSPSLEAGRLYTLVKRVIVTPTYLDNSKCRGLAWTCQLGVYISDPDRVCCPWDDNKIISWLIIIWYQYVSNNFDMKTIYSFVTMPKWQQLYKRFYLKRLSNLVKDRGSSWMKLLIFYYMMNKNKWILK